MKVDTQTLRDLEVFQSRDGGPSLYDAVNRTRTGLGDQCLRAQLASPESDAATIRPRHEAIKFLAECGVEWPVDEHLAQDVVSYFGSRFSTLQNKSGLGAAAEAIWIGVRYPEMLLNVERGVRATRELVAQTSTMVGSLMSRTPPTGLATICHEIHAMTESVAAVCRERSIVGEDLKVDRELRVRRKTELQRLLTRVGELDALFSGASLLAEGYVLPQVEVTPGVLFEGEGIWHPFLPNAVRNPVTLKRGETLVFLTGPNMAGKSTYLRAVGACIYLAHCGYPVPATRLTISPVEALFTSISPEDHLRSGLSFFMAEVKRVREVLESVAMGERSIAIFDEVFRGTNVHDAMEASREVILGCARARNSGFLFSSHIVELAEDLAAQPSVKFFCFDAEILGETTAFDYTLRGGVSDRRFGMELLRREGIPDLLAKIPAEPMAG